MSNTITRNKPSHDFSRTPKIKLPRSVFPMGFSNMLAMNASYLTPICNIEVNPGDTWEVDLEEFGRLATQVVPSFDNVYIKTYFFFDPYRLSWPNFTKQHGERKKPDDTIDYLTPQMNTGSDGGVTVGSIYDYMGIPIGIENLNFDELHFRTYNRVMNAYFRSEQLDDPLYENDSDTASTLDKYELFRIRKPFDYFTACLPNLQLGEPVTLPLGTTAQVVGNGYSMHLANGADNVLFTTNNTQQNFGTVIGNIQANTDTEINEIYHTKKLLNGKALTGLQADLSQATAATITALREAIAIQELLERDNRNGTRYTEQLAGRYGVTNPDLLLYRPQYLGGTSQLISINPVLQTSATGQTGAETPQGNMTGYGIFADGGKVIRNSFTEFGVILGLAVITTIPSYQQGLHRKFSRQQRYDYYYPEFAHLSDQPVYNKEIFAQGEDVVDSDGNIVDDKVFGYQTRYSDYQYMPNEIHGALLSTANQSLDVWHFAEKFENLPQLNGEFLKDKSYETINRCLAVQAQEGEPELPQALVKFNFNSIVYRSMPLYSIPRISPMI